MKFSVLMSVYRNDDPEYFLMALESVSINQTVKPSQIVIVQDGKVDSQIDYIIEKTMSKVPEIEFSIIKKPQNEGLASALNDGLEYCKYTYVARMDSDDIAVDKRFELQVEFMKSNPQIDVLGGYIAEFNDDPLKLGKIRRVGENHEDIVRMAKHRCPFNHMTIMYKKDKVEDVGKYSIDFGKLEDYKLWVDMISAGCICANIPRVLIKMRIGNGMIRRRSNPREIKDWDRLQKYLLDAHIINQLDAISNKLYIRIFTYMPSSLKKAAYGLFLRK